ncbi:MAG: D-alanyl-D-alanine carboxypeptidase [Treponema sp.]|nr:D-alanyl-D-alanine carboxypeptidase [Candidatus Treponema equi]
MKKINIKIIAAGIFLSSAIFFSALGFSVSRLTSPKNTRIITDTETRELLELLDGLYPERTQNVTQLPYKTIPADLDIYAGSAILIDQETGNILYEKNADMEIPPASMTKLVEMYVVYEAVRNGETSLDDVVNLPPQSWSVNLPSDASRMFLGEGQKVTLRELLLGLAIASGNDASIAVANHVCGDMDSFVQRMNDLVKKLGMTKTHFVESSGYSEKNITTAREFAGFCRIYLRDFPESLSNYHAKEKLVYPEKKNLPPAQRNNPEIKSITQYNTNKLLGVLEGCDGLKTGYIDESGYNIAVTVRRGNRRFVSITMKGPGTGSIQGNKYRVLDGTALMEFAFAKFAPYKDNDNRSFVVGCAGTKEKSIRLIPATQTSFSVPFITGTSPEDAASKVIVKAEFPPYHYGEIQCGQEMGRLTYSLEGKTLMTVPLVADRKNPARGFPGRIWGKIVYSSANLF